MNNQPITTTFTNVVTKESDTITTTKTTTTMSYFDGPTKTTTTTMTTTITTISELHRAYSERELAYCERRESGYRSARLSASSDPGRFCIADNRNDAVVATIGAAQNDAIGHWRGKRRQKRRHDWRHTRGHWRRKQR